MTLATIKHDPTVQDLCGCSRCEELRAASLATSRATSAIQAAAWNPRSLKLRDAARKAVEERDAAIKTLEAHPPRSEW